MNTFLWILQGLLAASFAYSGICKSFLSKQQLIAIGQTGVVNLSTPLIRTIAICELLGAIGLILPWYTGIWPVLTPMAAVGFAVIMVFAARIHYRMKEPQNVAKNALLFVLSIFVAWGRFSQL